MLMLMARLIGELEAGKERRNKTKENLKVLRDWSRHIVKLVSHVGFGNVTAWAPGF